MCRIHHELVTIEKPLPYYLTNVFLSFAKVPDRLIRKDIGDSINETQSLPI